MSARSIQGQLAAATRYHPTEDHSDLKRELKTEQLAERIAAEVDTWPPLTEEQRTRLARMLSGGGVGV